MKFFDFFFQYNWICIETREIVYIRIVQNLRLWSNIGTANHGADSDFLSLLRFPIIIETVFIFHLTFDSKLSILVLSGMSLSFFGISRPEAQGRLMSLERPLSYPENVRTSLYTMARISEEM